MITGINHITFAVSDLSRSLAFYRDLLGCTEVRRWAGGAYLEAGGTWLCLSLDSRAASQVRSDYTHVAFSVSSAAFRPMKERLEEHRVRIWKDNRSEGDSVYFLDPDGHKLEIHVGTLASRLAAMSAEGCRAG